MLTGVSAARLSELMYTTVGLESRFAGYSNEL